MYTYLLQLYRNIYNHWTTAHTVTVYAASFFIRYYSIYRIQFADAPEAYPRYGWLGVIE